VLESSQLVRLESDEAVLNAILTSARFYLHLDFISEAAGNILYNCLTGTERSPPRGLWLSGVAKLHPHVFLVWFRTKLR